MHVVEGLLYLMAAGLLMPVLVLLVQVVSALPRRGPAAPVAGVRPRVAVLIPAHDEVAGLPATLHAIFPQLEQDDRVLVVADNCTDDTAAVAREAGAEVVERHDAVLRGKGYALDFGVHYLAADPPEVVVIVDADCIMQPGALDRIARLSWASVRPVQALYEMRSPPAAGRFGRIAEFAWTVKNLARPLGFLRLGQPCQLMGSGMAFPWPCIVRTQLASGHIVEDMQMGVDLARAGAAPLFCPEAVVESRFPANRAGTDSQRRRWEHGHLGMIVKAVPAMLAEGVLQRRPQVLALALDLCVPPLALLGMLVGVALLAAGLAALVGAAAGPLALATLLFVLFVLAVGLAWLRFGRNIVGLPTMLLAVAYALRKVPLYAGFVVRRQVAWVRSKRDAEHAD
jgi:cellulose synthase/poly-beta-1,6-N-acetylglucosamine synthase-like glycosyltransferase